MDSRFQPSSESRARPGSENLERQASRRSWLALLVAAALGTGTASASAQTMTVSTDPDTGQTIPPGGAQGNSDDTFDELHDFEYDFLNGLEQPAESGSVFYQSITAIDTRYVNGTSTETIDHRYKYTINITAPGKCWKLVVSSSRRGEIGAWADEDDRGYAYATISALTGSTDYSPPPTGELSQPNWFEVGNSANEHSNDRRDIIDEPSVAVFTGFGSKSFNLFYSWDAYLSSTVCGPEDNLACVLTPRGGDEAIVEMGLNVDWDDPGQDAIDNGRTPHTGWGHRVDFQLTTTTPVSISGCGETITKCVDERAELTVNATGDNLFYRWYRVVVTQYEIFIVEVDSGYGLSTLVIDPVEAGDEGDYYCEVSNDCGPVTSCPIYLNVVPVPQVGPIQVTPAQPMCLGDDLTLTATPASSEFEYRWQVRPEGATEWQNIGGNSHNYFKSNVTASASGSYRVFIYNDECEELGGWSDPIVVTVVTPPAIGPIMSGPIGGPLTNDPAEVCAGEDLVLSAAVTGTPPFEYQWFCSGPGGMQPIPNASGITSVSPIGYTVTDAAQNSGGAYRLDVKNPAKFCGLATRTANVTVFMPITVTGSLDQPFCPEEPKVLAVQASAPLTNDFVFRWYWENVLIWTDDGPMSVIHLPRPVQQGQVAGRYRVEVSHEDGDCPSTTLEGDVTVLDPPVVTLSASPDPQFLALCGAPEVTLSANVSQASPPFTFEWFRNGVLDGAGPPNEAVYDLGPVFEAVTYEVEVTSADGCKKRSAPLALAAAAGEHGDWHGADGEHFLSYGPWRGLEPDPSSLQGCGNVDGVLGTTEACPPFGIARLRNLAAGSRSAVFASGETWTLDRIELGGSSGEQKLRMEGGSSLTAMQCFMLKPQGVLDLRGGTLETGQVRNDGRIEGYGQLAAAGYFDNHGLIQSDGSSANLLDLVPTGELGLQNHPGATLRVPESAASVRVVGDLRNGEENVPIGGLVDIEEAARLTVTGDVVNDGLVKIAGAPLAPGSNLSFGSLFTNRGGWALPNVPQLFAGLWLQGGRIAGTSFRNHVGARTHGYGVIDSNVLNEGMLRVTDQPGSILTVLGCIENDGVVRIDADHTLVLSGGLCNQNDGAIEYDGDGDCVGPCVPARVQQGGGLATLVIGSGGLDNGRGASLDVRGGLIQVFGDFRSEIADPYAFDLSGTRLEIAGDGTGSASELVLAAPDLGALGDFGARAAMAVAELVVGPSPSVVVLADQPGGGASTLYVRNLIVSAGNTLDLGSTRVYAENVTLEPGATLSLSSGELAYGSINLPDPCGSGQVLGGDCGTQLAPMPAPDCDADGTSDAAEIAGGAADCNANGVPDECDLTLQLSLDQDGNTVPDECQLLHADRPWISAHRGGRQKLSLHAGAAHAGRSYVLSAWFGRPSPEPFSRVRQQTLGGPTRVETPGMLDGEGNATSAAEFEPGQIDPSLIGLNLFHKYAVLHNGQVVARSNATALELRP